MATTSKLATSRTLSASFPNPDSPQCGEEDGRGVEKPTGWYSERVPNPSQKRYVAAAALMPFNSGRALPSKWDDAERWISSPVSVANVSTSGNISNCYNEGGGNKGNSLSAHFQRRAKSKSGPLGPAGVGVYGSYSNTFSPVLGVGVINGAKWRNSLATEFPALAQGHFEGRLSLNSGGLCEGGRRSLPGRGDPEWLDLWSGPSSPSDRGKVSDGAESINNRDNNHQGGCYDDDDGRGIDRAISSRRDMATQMYPESDQSCSCPSIMSSPRSTISSTNSPCDKLNMNVHFSQVLEVKDVQVDNETNRKAKRSSLKATHVQQNSSNSTHTDGDNTITKLQREEARIDAWEKLQKAKAESSIQKLEMKLEKKRASSMEKIIEKLRRSEIRAHMMRISLFDGTSSNNNVQSRAISKGTSKLPSFYKRFRLTRSSTSNCVTCYPF